MMWTFIGILTGAIVAPSERWSPPATSEGGQPPRAGSTTAVIDHIFLIWSNHNGDPQRGTQLLHWVRLSSLPNPAPVNQLAAGGRFPHADCGEADVRSILLNRGIDDPLVRIEHEGERRPAGTWASQLIASLAEDHVAAIPTHSLPAGGTVTTIMNRSAAESWGATTGPPT